MKITKKTKIGDILEKNPEKALLFQEAGMGCALCPMAQMETIEQGCEAHGLGEKEIDKLVKELNK